LQLRLHPWLSCSWANSSKRAGCSGPRRQHRCH